MSLKYQLSIRHSTPAALACGCSVPSVVVSALNAATIVEVIAVSEARIPVRRVKTEVIPGDVWDQSSQRTEAMDAEAELVSQTTALRSDPMPLPARRPGPRR